jgi:hypothetical protein
MQRYACHRERLVRVHKQLRRLSRSENLAKSGARRVQLDQVLEKSFNGRVHVLVCFCASNERGLGE